MLPHFLGIGAQKAGTTWLHRNLGAHPEIALPEVKEVHYFDRLFPVPLRQPRAFARHDLAWYEAMFAHAEGKVTGDITPAYGALSQEGVDHARAVLPDAKLVFLMRDPVERAWSHACMYLTRNLGKSVGQLTDDELIEHFDHPACTTRGDYLGTLDRWTRCYPPERFFVGFFDDLRDRPEELLAELFRFLGVEASQRHVPANARQKVFSSSPGAVPERHARYLSARLAPLLEGLHRKFGGHATVWWRQAQERLAGRPGV